MITRKKLGNILFKGLTTDIVPVWFEVSGLIAIFLFFEILLVNVLLVEVRILAIVKIGFFIGLEFQILGQLYETLSQ